MGRPSNIPPEQRTELVWAVLRGTEKLEVLARRHQVSANTLRKWREEFVAAGQERLSGRGDAVAAAGECKQLKRELAERELIIGELTVAQRFLQKLVLSLEGKVDRSKGTMGNEKNGKRTCEPILVVYG